MGGAAPVSMLVAPNLAEIPCSSSLRYPWSLSGLGTVCAVCECHEASVCLGERMAQK